MGRDDVAESWSWWPRVRGRSADEERIMLTMTEREDLFRAMGYIDTADSMTGEWWNPSIERQTGRRLIDPDHDSADALSVLAWILSLAICNRITIEKDDTPTNEATLRESIAKNGLEVARRLKTEESE